MIDNILLKELLETITVSGHEKAGGEVVRRHMESVSDAVLSDDIGGTICVLNPDASPRVLMTVHLDEIGLMVSVVTEKGRLTAVRRGGIIPAVYPGYQVLVMTGNGPVCGVVESYRDFFQKKGDVDTKDLLIDIGVDTREDALVLTEPGSPVVSDIGVQAMAGGRFSVKALDDRLGVYIIAEALKRARERACTCGMYSVAIVGEETTKSGAYWTACRVRPDLTIVVDVTYACDCTGTSMTETGDVKLGGGPVLCNSPIVSKHLNRMMRACADSADIRVQTETVSASSYTDADKVHFAQERMPVALVSIPLRYIHHPAEVADEKDVEDCIVLIAEFLARYQELNGARQG